jgi:hypothetical protein
VCAPPVARYLRAQHDRGHTDTLIAPIGDGSAGQGRTRLAEASRSQDRPRPSRCARRRPAHGPGCRPGICQCRRGEVNPADLPSTRSEQERGGPWPQPAARASGTQVANPGGQMGVRGSLRDAILVLAQGLRPTLFPEVLAGTAAVKPPVRHDRVADDRGGHVGARFGEPAGDPGGVMARIELLHELQSGPGTRSRPGRTYPRAAAGRRRDSDRAGYARGGAVGRGLRARGLIRIPGEAGRSRTAMPRGRRRRTQ